MRFSVYVSLLLIMGFRTIAQDKPPTVLSDLELLQGEWEVVTTAARRGEAKGFKRRMRIKGNEETQVFNNRETHTKFSLDPTKTPKEMDPWITDLSGPY